METASSIEKLVEELSTYANLTPVKTYLRRLNHPNFWTIIGNGRKSYETYYSKTLAWMLDPTANHGAQGAFAQKLLNKISTEDKQERIQISTSNPYNDLTVYRGADTEALGAHIDVFHYDEITGTAITIEAKMGSLDHHAGSTDISQLDKYYEAVENNPTVVEKCPNRYYIYLTVTGTQPTIKATSHDRWACLSYAMLAEAAKEFIFDLNDDGAVKIVRDFIFDLERHAELAGDRLSEAAHPFREDQVLLNQIRLMASSFTESTSSTKEATELFDAVSKDISLHGINRQTLKYIIEALNETLADKKQDHTPSPLGQELIKKSVKLLPGKNWNPIPLLKLRTSIKFPAVLNTYAAPRVKARGFKLAPKIILFSIFQQATTIMMYVYPKTLLKFRKRYFLNQACAARTGKSPIGRTTSTY